MIEELIIFLIVLGLLCFIKGVNFCMTKLHRRNFKKPHRMSFSRFIRQRYNPTNPRNFKDKNIDGW